MMKDLVLETLEKWTWWKSCNSERVQVILPNIQGQKYTLGSVYPGEREGEEFIFCRYATSPINPTHCVISVDKQGQYWIQNDTRNVERRATRSSVYNTFVNGEKVNVVELRLLKSGDVISLGDPGTRRRPNRLPIFCVKERIIGGGFDQIDNGDEAGNAMICAESPLANNLILSEIMSYLPVKELKTARRVCKKWKAEASKHLEKLGKVSFTFDGSYVNSKNSTRVFRYLNEMRELKIRNLHISLSYYNTLLISPGTPGEKMMDDLRKLLKSSHNFSSLVLKADIEKESDFLFVSTIFEELGGKLVKLTLDGPLNLKSLPEVVPPFPLMTKLKRFSHYGPVLGNVDDKLKWVSILVPLFSKNLEHFTCKDEMAEPYLQAFFAQDIDMPNLRGIAVERRRTSYQTLPLLLALKSNLAALKIDFYPASEEEIWLLKELLFKHSSSLQTLKIRIHNDHFPNSKNPVVKFPSFPKLEELGLEYDQRTRVTWETGFSYNTLAFLLALKNRLTSLKFLCCYPQAEEGFRLLEKLLLKHSPSLQTLEFSIFNSLKNAEVKFPSFPKLVELELGCNSQGARISWETNLDYKEHFPSLRKLTVWPPQPWSGDDPVLNAFFPKEGEMSSETVKKVGVPVLSKPKRRASCSYAPDADLASFQLRMDQIRKMFPTARKINFIKY